MNNLKEIRKQLGLTQQEVAKRLGVVQKTYSNYENETTEPSIEMLIKLSEMFHTSIDNLINENVDKIDVNNLMPYQKELIDLISQANQVECAKIQAYTLGLFEGKKEYERKKEIVNW